MTACGCSLPAGACPLYHILLLVRAPQLGCHVCTGSMYIYIHTHMCVCVCVYVCVCTGTCAHLNRAANQLDSRRGRSWMTHIFIREKFAKNGVSEKMEVWLRFL